MVWEGVVRVHKRDDAAVRIFLRTGLFADTYREGFFFFKYKILPG